MLSKDGWFVLSGDGDIHKDRQPKPRQTISLSHFLNLPRLIAKLI
jgi:hypothetical protein